MFELQKKQVLERKDKSTKGFIDKRVVSLLEVINSQENYYTTSSCSGRVVLWRGTGKKFENEWLKVSHGLVTEEFFKLEGQDGVIWFRLEPFIIHVCCKDQEVAKSLLDTARTLYKKSSILTLGKRIIVEIRGSEHIEMPLYINKKLVFSENISWLTQESNKKLEKIWKKIEELSLFLS